ncbi:MAG: nucleoside deaminase [Bacilli bacterium]
MNETIFNELYKLSMCAFKHGEIPVSAVIVKNNIIIAKGYNKRNTSNNPLDHAEIIAIKKACKKSNNWRLNGCDLYVTLKPCSMCSEVIKECRINNVYYLLDNEKCNNLITNFIKVDHSYGCKIRDNMQKFFLDKR